MKKQNIIIGFIILIMLLFIAACDDSLVPRGFAYPPSDGSSQSSAYPIVFARTTAVGTTHEHTKLFEFGFSFFNMRLGSEQELAAISSIAGSRLDSKYRSGLGFNLNFFIANGQIYFIANYTESRGTRYNRTLTRRSSLYRYENDRNVFISGFKNQNRFFLSGADIYYKNIETNGHSLDGYFGQGEYISINRYSFFRLNINTGKSEKLSLQQFFDALHTAYNRDAPEDKREEIFINPDFQVRGGRGC